MADSPIVTEHIPGLKTWKNTRNGFKIIRLHYTADPDKATPEWKANARIGVSDADWEREMEINFEQQRGKRVIANYDPITHQLDMDINEYKPLLRSWDFGYRRPACVISQLNTDDQWCILYEFLGQDTLIEDFAQHVLDNSPQVSAIDNAKYEYKDFCDPAGTQQSDKAKRTSIEVLNALGIHPRYQKSSPAERARIMRSKFAIRPDGKPGAMVHSRCRIISEGLLGGYHYPEDAMKGHEEDPEKDGFYDHVFDALGYKAYFLFRYMNADPAKQKPRRPQYVQKNYGRYSGS